MSSRQESPLVITGLRGRDGYSSSPSEVPVWRATEMLNVDLYRSTFARKRGGAVNIFTITTGESFTGVMSAMTRFIPGPGGKGGSANLWAIDDAATPVVQVLGNGGVIWTTPTLKDNFTSSAQHTVFCSFKGKLFITGPTAQDRLHCWDPDDGSVRRTGLATPAAATVANTGIGTYAATLRYYKIRYVKKSGSTYLLASELSANVSFTPSGVGTAARITKPAALSEGETHWQVFASADDNLYFNIAETVVGTTTYDDSASPSIYTGDAPPLVGTHTNWVSVRYLLAAHDHLIGAGGWASGAYTSRVWWSGVTNQTGIGDEESVIQTVDVSNYADLQEADGNEITGLAGPIDGRVFVFKRNQAWLLIPTGSDSPFYRPELLTPRVGSLRHHANVMGEDAAGRPCLYWLSEKGPYRFGADGLQFLGDDIQDIWESVYVKDPVLGAGGQRTHGIWHQTKRQIWWWVSTGSGTNDTKLVFDVRMGKVYEDGRVRDGWFKHDGVSAAARCSTMYGAGRDADGKLVPFAGKETGTVILECDTTDTDDAGTSFQAYVDLPDRHLAGIGHRCTVGHPAILGNAGTQSLQVTLTANYDSTTARTGSVSMAAAGSETRTLREVEEVEYGDAATNVKLRVGDSAANTATWTIDALIVPFEVKEAVTQ